MININKRLRKFTATSEIRKQQKKEMQMILLTMGVLMLVMGAIMVWLSFAINKL